MMPSVAELTTREAQLQAEMQTLHAQLDTWRTDTPLAIQQNYPTVYALRRAIGERAVEHRRVVRQLQLARGE
jgi:hypothetical protein